MERAMKEDITLHNPESDKQSENFSKMVIEEADIVKPIIKEQLFREFISGTSDTNEILKIFCKTFGIEEGLKTRMLIIKPTEKYEHDELFFLRNIAEKSIGEARIAAGAVIRRHILIITDITGKDKIISEVDKLRKRIRTCYDSDVIAVYSDVMSFADAPVVYERLFRCLGYAFYASDNRTLYEGDVNIHKETVQIDAQYVRIEKAVRSGNVKSVNDMLDSFFAELESAAPCPGVAKTYCLELYVCIIRCCEAEKIDKYMKGIVSIQTGATLAGIRSFITLKANEITVSNAPLQTKRYSALIEETIAVIDNNISNENLSLRWLAGTILYTNVDYLGKLFKKEIGRNFSHYVMEKRMEMAKNLIMGGKKDRIYEVAEKVGYGSNPQYFSQVFKKYTGISPLEYKEYARLNAGKGTDKSRITS